MDIIVTTPKSEMASAAREAADCIAAGGGEYFRRFPLGQAPDVKTDDHVYYVEDGFIRGYAKVKGLFRESESRLCETTGRRWQAGAFVVMDAASWRWIRPIPMQGFQGFRYIKYRYEELRLFVVLHGLDYEVEVVGGWLDPRPKRCTAGRILITMIAKGGHEKIQPL